MKTNNCLLFLYIFLTAISSCKVHEDTMLMKDRESSATKDLPVELPTADSHLFTDVAQSIKDSVLIKLRRDIEKESQYPPKHANRKNLRSRNSEIRFAPVIRLYSHFESIQKGIPHFKKLEDEVYFYEVENGKILSLYSAEYRDRSNFTKDTSPELYQAFVELYGKEYADNSVELTRNTRGADRWTIHPYSQEGTLMQLIHFAFNQSDDGKVSVLIRGTMPRITYFQNGQFLYCQKVRPGEDIYVGSVEELMR